MDKELYFTPWYTWDLRGPTCMLTEMLPKHIQAPIEKKHCMPYFLCIKCCKQKTSKELTSVVRILIAC